MSEVDMSSETRNHSQTALAAALLAVAMLACSAGHAQDYPEYRSPVRDPDRIFRHHVWSWKELHEKNIVMQKRDFSCGAAALATVLQHYWGDPVTESRILEQFDDIFTPAEVQERIKNGLTITDLRRAAVKLGYQSSIGTLRYEQLQESKVPLVVGITVGEFKHFVVYRGTDGYYVYLADPARGNIRVPASDFVKQWQKNAVLVVAKKGQEPKTWSPLSLRPEETYHGELNRVEIQKQLTRRSVVLPAPKP
jgi:predicted double-glycine peptidase